MANVANFDDHDPSLLRELTALRKLRSAVSKMVIYATVGQGASKQRTINPRDWQQINMFLREANRVTNRHIGDDPHV